MKKTKYETKDPCSLCGGHEAKLVQRLDKGNAVKCKNCGLIFVDPMPEINDYDEIYGGQYYEGGWRFSKRGYTDPLLQDIMMEGFGRELKEVEKFIDVKGRVLDIGCADGQWLRVAKANGWDTFGVESSEYSRSIAINKHGLNVVGGTFEEATFPDDYFDLIVMRHLIEHLRNPLQSLEICNKILKQGRVIPIETDNVDGIRGNWIIILNKIFNHIPKFIKKMYWKYKGLSRDEIAKRTVQQYPGGYGRMGPPVHLFYFTKETLQEMLLKAGFEIIEYKSVGYGDKIYHPMPYRYKVNPIELLLRIVEDLGQKLFKKGDIIVLIGRKI